MKPYIFDPTFIFPDRCTLKFLGVKCNPTNKTSWPNHVNIVFSYEHNALCFQSLLHNCQFIFWFQTAVDSDQETSDSSRSFWSPAMSKVLRKRYSTYGKRTPRTISRLLKHHRESER